MRWRSWQQRGMTLIELMIALGLGSAVALSVWQLMDVALRLASQGMGQAAAQQAVRVALDRMTDQVRQAVAFADTKPNQLAITIRTSEDTDPYLIRFVVKPDGSLSELRGSRAAPKRLVDGKDARVQNLAIAYFDAQGWPTTIAQEVRLVRITLATLPVRGRTNYPEAKFTVTTMVRLRAEP